MKHNNCGQKQNNIFKKTGLRHIIVNCQLSIVNSAKPFKHQFAERVRSGNKYEKAGETGWFLPLGVM